MGKVIALSAVREARTQERRDQLLSDLVVWADYLAQHEPKAAKALSRAARKLVKVKLGEE